MSYILKTKSGMYRAKDGEWYPWTANRDEARRFDTETEADLLAEDHARFTERPISDYIVEPA